MAETIDDALHLAAPEHYPGVVAIRRADGSIHASVVNAGEVQHPLTGDRAIGFVTYGPVKLSNLRERPEIAVTYRAGWSWATIEGTANIIGPDDANPVVDAEQLRVL